MKQEALLLDRSEDFKHYGINPNAVEEWEDGVRDTSEPNHFEWWYFDCMLDDGTKVVIQFLSKNGRTFSSNKFHPTLFYKVTTPDGRQIDKELHIPAKDIQWSKETCDVHFGKHSVCGNLKEYKIHIDLVDGMGADLTLKSTSKPYRPGTSYFQFGTPEQYYTWLCVVPRGTVTGTITVEGKTKSVTGTGYHDHQWGSINFHKYWNHWIWARQSYEDCSLLLFDFFTNEEYGTKRFPIIFIQDNEGNLIFESHDQVECRVEKQYTDDASGKVYPKALQYVFHNGETTVEYHLQAEKTIECKGKNNLPLLMKFTMKLMHIQASYSRYTAKGDLSLKSADRTIDRNGALIYEIMCPGEKCVELMGNAEHGMQAKEENA